MTWTRRRFAELFDRYIPEWRHDNLYLRYAVSIPLAGDPRRARRGEGGRCSRRCSARTGVTLDPKVMTIGFARRADAVQARAT